MALSVFDNKALMPDNEMLDMVLGNSKIIWDNIKQYIKNLVTEWKFYGKDSGWTLNVKSSKRTIFALIPMEGCFKTNFTLGEKAVLEAKNSNLPKEIIESMPDAKQCVCGYSFMFDVKTSSDEDTVVKLIKIKEKN